MTTTRPPVPLPRTADSTPQDLLAAADRLLGTAPTSTTGIWPRAAALLLRHALEEGLRRYWTRRRPEVARCSMHAQALCLAVYTNPDTARRWSAVWSNLSRACHYHGYELAPTAAELHQWRDDVAGALRELDDRMGPPCAP
ncbi:hypothetical protein [Streptomyces sp. NPDC003023]|uniref:hypothetical protein n=1 Tax=Streptomyces sp. NPDC003023 TaxID=3364675 RepID=UPI003673AFFB